MSNKGQINKIQARPVNYESYDVAIKWLSKTCHPRRCSICSVLPLTTIVDCMCFPRYGQIQPHPFPQTIKSLWIPIQLPKTYNGFINLCFGLTVVTFQFKQTDYTFPSLSEIYAYLTRVWFCVLYLSRQGEDQIFCQTLISLLPTLFLFLNV